MKGCQKKKGGMNIITSAPLCKQFDHLKSEAPVAIWRGLSRPLTNTTGIG